MSPGLCNQGRRSPHRLARRQSACRRRPRGFRRRRRCRRASRTPFPATMSSPPCRYGTDPLASTCGSTEIRGRRRPDLPRLHHRRSAGRPAHRHRARRLVRSKTTGSTFRSPTCWSAACRSSITGARPWSPIRRRSGSAWNISATRPIDLWNMPDDEIARFAIAEVEKIGILHADRRARLARGSHAQDLPGLLRHLRPLRRNRSLRGPIREPVPGRPQRHAQIQQPGPLHAHRHDRRRQIVAGEIDKAALWEINTEQEYHEEKK